MNETRLAQGGIVGAQRCAKSEGRILVTSSSSDDVTGVKEGHSGGVWWIQRAKQVVTRDFFFFLDRYDSYETLMFQDL